MPSLTKQIVDRYGTLTEVCVVEWLSAGVGNVKTLGLAFEQGSLLVRANNEDDSISLLAPPSLQGEDISHQPPWREAIGRGVVWVWLLANQQGYEDACQIEFGKPTGPGQADSVTVQLVVAGSALHVSTVSEWTSRGTTASADR